MICRRIANGFVNGLVYQWIAHAFSMVCVWLVNWRVNDWCAVCRGYVNGSTKGMHANMKACIGACFLIEPQGILGVLPMV